MNRTSSLYLCFFVLIAYLCLSVHSQVTNTHQNITTNLPKMFKMSVSKGDQVRISIFDTNAQFQILFNMESQQLAVSQENICFADQKCSMQFKSLWDADGVVIIQVKAYQYSYEIILNGVEVKNEENVITSFIAGKFVYSKALQPDIYEFRVFYQSQFVHSIVMTLMDVNFTIKANEVNEVAIQVEEEVPFYYIFFTFSAQGFEQITQHLFPISIEIPNKMLKGCDGTNLYDPKIRACPIPNIKVQDTIKISKIGSYPTFQLKQQQKVQIKITIIQFKKWTDFFNEQFLTVYIGDSSDPRAFYGLNKFQISTKFKTKQQCSMKDTSCTFSFSLAKGNYTVMPVFPKSAENSFVYLYERFNGNQKVESLYSVLPTILQTDKKYYQLGVLLELNNHKQKLTEIEINCEEPFLLAEYMIMKKSGIVSPMGAQYDIVDFSSDQIFNRDFYQAHIFSELQPNQNYIIFMQLMSQKKLSNANKQAKEEDEDLIDFEMQDEIGASYQSPQSIKDVQDYFYLQAASIQLKIRNGGFPHKKLTAAQEHQQQQQQNTEITQQKILQPKKQQAKQQAIDQSKDKQHLSTEESQNIPSETPQVKEESKQSSSSSILLQVLGALVIILVILFLVYLFFLNTTPTDEKEHNELVTEQPTGSITIPDNSIQISQIIKTQSQTSHQQTSQREESHNEPIEMEEYQQSTQNQASKE